MSRPCTGCGFQVNDQTKYCPQCGNEVPNQPIQQPQANQHMYQQPQANQHMYQQPQANQHMNQPLPYQQTPFVNDNNSGQQSSYWGPQPVNDYEMDIMHFAQSNSEVYIRKIRTMKMNRQNSSWNWSSFLVPMYWAFYRKMYPIGLGILAASIISQFIPMVGGMITLGISIYLGIMGNYYYMQHMEKSFLEANKIGLKGQARVDYLKQQGGTNGALVVAILVGMTIVYILFAAAFLDQFSRYMLY